MRFPFASFTFPLYGRSDFNCFSDRTASEINDTVASDSVYPFIFTCLFNFTFKYGQFRFTASFFNFIIVAESHWSSSLDVCSLSFESVSEFTLFH